MLTSARLKELLHYDPDTGVFTWLPTVRHCYKGKVAGTILKLKNTLTSYIHIKVDGRLYLAHRLAFLYVHGRFPDGPLDHRGCDGLDNRIDNLRECSHGQNIQNIGCRKDNTSGVKGVALHGKSGKWVAYVNHCSKRYYLGLFKTIAEAEEVVRAKRSQLHGEYANHG